MSLNRKFYCQSEKVDDQTIKVVGYTEFFDNSNEYDDSTVYLSPQSMLRLIEIMEDFEAFHIQSASLMGKSFQNEFDDVEYTIRGNDRYPTFSIWNFRTGIDGKKLNGVINIPYQSYDREEFYENVGQVIDEFKKYI